MLGCFGAFPFTFEMCQKLQMDCRILPTTSIVHKIAERSQSVLEILDVFRQRCVTILNGSGIEL
jgi:hypothetical protein